MAEKTPDPVVLPDVATQPHPTGHEEEGQRIPPEAKRANGEQPATPDTNE